MINIPQWLYVILMGLLIIGTVIAVVWTVKVLRGGKR